MFTKKKIYDTQTGLRAIPIQYIDQLLNIPGSRYEYEMNMLIFFTNEKINIIEIPISTIYIDNNRSSNFKIFKDSFKIYKCLFFHTQMRTITLFTISAILSFIIDYFLLINLTNIFLDKYIYSISLLFSVLIARFISSLFNFCMNYFIVFKSTQKILKSIFKYYLLVILVVILNYLLLNIFTITLKINLKLSKIIVEFILFIFNYLIQKYHILNKAN